jgi:hypothetical protein
LSKEEKHARLSAIRAVITGQLPTIEKQIVKVVTLRKGRSKTKKEKSKGRLANATMMWTDKIPHPSIMSRLDEINADPDIDSAITNLTEMVAASFFTEMGEDVQKIIDPATGKEKTHPNKVKLDAWAEKHRVDENLKMAVREAFEKGFFAIDLDPDDDFEPKVLPSESMYMWRKPDEKKPYKFTQEFGGQVVDTWEGEDLDRIVWWAHKETPINPYGKALAFCLEEFVDARREMTDDGNAVLHRLGYPDRRFECKDDKIRDLLYNEYTKKEPDEAVFLAGVEEGDIKEVTSQLQNIRINFEGFQQSNDTRITNNLNAPTMSTLRNATEASATKMLEFYDSYAQGIQHSLKRTVENSMFQKVIGAASPTNPIPNLTWGRQKTGLEKLTGADVAQLKTSGCITFEQAQDLLKKLGLPLMDLPSPAVPIGTAPAAGSPVGLSDVPQLNPDRMKTLQTALDVVEKNFAEKNIGLADAYKEGAAAIRAHVGAARREVVARLQKDTPGARLSPEAENYFKILEFNLGSKFKERLMPTGAHKLEVAEHGESKQYTVTVNA